MDFVKRMASGAKQSFTEFFSAKPSPQTPTENESNPLEEPIVSASTSSNENLSHNVSAVPCTAETKPIEHELPTQVPLTSNNSNIIDVIDSIKIDYIKLYSIFIINTNQHDLVMLREIEEKLNRLIYRLDDIDVLDDNTIKSNRSQVINLIQDCLQKVQTNIRRKEKGTVKVKKQEVSESPTVICLDDSIIDLSKQPPPLICLDDSNVNELEQEDTKKQILCNPAIKQENILNLKQAPIQLLIRNTEGLFELDEAVIKSVLCGDYMKNRKIAIVSVVGAFRKRKAFLLNFMLRYLNDQGSPSWLTEDKNQPGENPWLIGEEMNSDILMWPTPYLIGKNLAVILLDTQVSFDDETKLKDNKFIFALSTLLSSVQIYDMNEKIQLQDINNLHQFFIDFGQLVETSCDSKLCDKSIFLVEEWKFPNEKEFGFIGGQQLLQNWIDEAQGNETEQTSKMLQVCYNKTSCFLMPSPGDQNDHEFSLKEPIFIELLGQFTESVFECEVSVKNIGGYAVTAQDLYPYMVNYVEKLQHPRGFDPKAVFQSMVDISQEKAVNKAKEVYMIEMESSLTDANIDMPALHVYALANATRIFDTAHKFGANHVGNAFKKKLTENLEDTYKQLQMERANRNHIDEMKLISASNEAYMIFHSSFSAFCMNQYPSCSIQEGYTKACTLAENCISELKLSLGKKSIEKELKKLRKKMQRYYNNQAPIYTNKHKQEAVSKISQEVLATYRNMMDIYCRTTDPISDFDKVHAKAALAAQEKLNTGIRNNHLEDTDVFCANMCKEINELAACYKQQNDSKLETKTKSKTESTLNEVYYQAIELYRSKMDEKCSAKSVDNLKNIHDEVVKSSLSLFEKYWNTTEKNVCAKYIEKTKEKLQTLLYHYDTLNNSKKDQNRHDQQLTLMQSSENHYITEMKKIKAGVDYVVMLHQHHSDFKKQALAMLKPLDNYKNYSQLLTQIEQKIDREFTKYFLFNQRKQLENMRENKAKCFQFYKDQMKTLNIGNIPLDNLEQNHEDFMQQALDKFTEALQGVENKNYEETIMQLRQDIEKQWKKYNDKNTAVRRLFENQESSTIMGAYTQMKAQYILAMNKYSNANDVVQLFKFHEKHLDEVTTMFMKMTKDCQQARRDEFLSKLKEDINESYQETEASLAKKMRDLRIAGDKSRPEKSFAIGIDLGTTNSCVAVYREGKVEIIYSDRYSDKNKTTTPSVVYFRNDEITFGETAIVGGFADPTHCISEIKRIIGRKFDDQIVQTLIQEWSFSVVEEDGMPIIQTPNFTQKSYKPEEISALVLGEMKRIAEVYLGSKVHDAVVTIPAYFNELQREATKAACVQAGLNVLRMINEPTAAAIAFGLQCKSEESRTLLLFDFGGGTCDISIVEVKGEKFTVKASKGDNKLGGEDFDDLLTEHINQIIQEKYNIVIDVKDKRRLRHNCERVKRNLSEESKYRLQIEKFTADRVDVDVLITREEFERVNENLFERVITPVEDCLESANYSKDKIDEVVMVGGTSRIPKIRQKLREFFNGKKMNVNINPDEAIAYGAAIQAAICTGEYKGGIEISEITPISLGIALKGGSFSVIVPKNTKIPVTVSRSDYSNPSDYISRVSINVYQGEHVANYNQNTKIGGFNLEGITEAPEGTVQFKVTFNIDADGILHVTAKERGREGIKKSLTLNKSIL